MTSHHSRPTAYQILLCSCTIIR